MCRGGCGVGRVRGAMGVDRHLELLRQVDGKLYSIFFMKLLKMDVELAQRVVHRDE